MENTPAAVKVVNNYQNAQEGIWPNGPVQLARGRQAKDPNAKIVTYNVSNIEEFETSLREYLHNPPEQPEHTECQLSFYPDASFLVSLPPSSSQSAQQHSHTPDAGALAQLALAQHQRQSHPDAHPHRQHQHPHLHQHPAHPSHPQAPPGYQPANNIHYGANASHTYQSVSDPAIALTLPAFPTTSSVNGSTSSANEKDAANMRRMSIQEALANTSDPKEKMKKQRAIAKCCIDTIQRTDGYRYSFHNCWNSREDDSFRFSYYCNDSLLNKDRAANGKGAKFGKRATKPVYDCKGVLSVKFSASKQSLDVFYKHVPVHKTYEERAPPPRKDSKRRKYLEENDPEALIRIANRPKPLKPPEPGEEDTSPKPKKKKTKRDDEPKTAANSIESDLRAQSLRSLLELIQTDPEPTPHEQPQPQNRIQPQGTNARVEEPSTQQPQAMPQQPRRRPRNSCNVCKTKKTKCDGARPVCSTCMDKKRQCFYSEPYNGDDRRQSMHDPQHATEPVLQAQAANSELSELERMKKELEEAKAKIQELQAEKTRTSSTPSHTPVSRTLSQSQAPPLQAPPLQSGPHAGPQPQIRNAAQSSNPQPPQQIRNAAQPSQQIRNAGQMQTPQYSHFNGSHAPYTANRPMPTAGHASQPQGNQQMHAASSGLTPAQGLTPTQDPTNPYNNRDFAWPTYYGYQNPPHNPQDQWAAAAGARNFR